MEPEIARRIIAEHLAGRPVSEADVQSALDALATDTEFAEHIRAEYGMHDQWMTECDIFMARLDEIAEASEEERARQFPRLSRHYRQCPRCYEAFWQAMPIWLEETGPGTVARDRHRSLAAPIVLRIGDTGGLSHEGVGMPPASQTQIAAAAGPDPSAQAGARRGDWREWVLEDADAGVTIRLVVVGAPGSQSALEIGLLVDPDSPVDASRTQIQIRDRATGRLVQAAALGTLGGEPLPLAPGTWTVRVESEAASALYGWDIPLNLERRSDV